MASRALNPPALSAIASIALKSAQGQEIVAKELWSKQPVLFYIMRRPGCILCRDQAVKVWEKREEFDTMGIKLVCIVHEWIQREIDAYHPAYWGGELYHDPAKAFYTVVGEGQLRKQSVLSLLNPWNKAYYLAAEAKQRVKDSNLAGDGTVLGGMLLVQAGEGGACYMSREESFGDFAPLEDVMAAAQKVAAKQ